MIAISTRVPINPDTSACTSTNSTMSMYTHSAYTRLYLGPYLAGASGGSDPLKLFKVTFLSRVNPWTLCRGRDMAFGGLPWGRRKKRLRKGREGPELEIESPERLYPATGLTAFVNDFSHVPYDYYSRDTGRSMKVLVPDISRSTFCVHEFQKMFIKKTIVKHKTKSIWYTPGIFHYLYGKFVT